MKKNSLDTANYKNYNKFEILYLQIQRTLITLLKQIGCNNSADTYYITTSLAGLSKHEPSQLPEGSMQPGLAATRVL